MNHFRVPFSHIDALSNFDKDYSLLDPKILPLINSLPNPAGTQKSIDERAEFPFYREELVEVLTAQYEKIGMLDQAKSTIKSLADHNTYTVNTAHQLNILTGPSYYIYKILTAIKLSQKLSVAGNHQIIPVFVLGAEDHDFEEIDHTYIYGKEVKWNRLQSGAVGRMSTQGWDQVINDLNEILGEKQADVLNNIFKETYLKYDNYAVAVQKLVAELFKGYNLLVLNMDDAIFKRIFSKVAIDEVKNFTTQKNVQATIEQINHAGIKVQVNPRDINLFYLSPEARQRITFDDGHYMIIGQDKKYALEEIIALIKAEPQNISPNVTLRPIFQEMILPNICFIGGGGELAYWIELKSNFAYHGVHYPVIMRRESILFIDKRMQQKIDKLELPNQLFFNDVDLIIRQYVEINSSVSLELKEEQKKLDELFGIIKEKGEKIDSTLVSTIEAEHTKWSKSLSHLESRLLRAEKKKNESAINQIKNIKEKLFPNNGLQERKDNFLPLYIKYGQAFFETLLSAMDPFDPDFLVVVEE